MSRNHRLVGLVAAALVACGGNNNMQTDSGVLADTGTADTGGGGTDGGRDGGASSVCDTPMAVTLAAGTQTVMGDTTGHTTGLVDFGAGCGGQTAGAQMAEQVIALTLPGTASDMVTVSFTLLTDGTDAMFDTTVQLRTTCTDATGAMCFDDSTVQADYRSDGTFNAPGGSTRYLVVSGYRMPEMGYTNVGPWQADFQTFVNPMPPTLTSATASLRDGDYLTVEAMGTDPQSAATGVIFSFLDATSTPIGVDLDADPTTPDVTEFGPYDFRPSVMGMMTFDGTSRVVGWGDTPSLLTATQLRVSVTDAAALMSNELTIALLQTTTVHVGDACDTTHVCAEGVDCAGTPAVCTVPAAIATACAGAMPITIATPTTTATSATAPVTLATTAGQFAGSCNDGGTNGDEHLFTVMVPTGAFDLVAETTDMMEMGPDTTIYDRTVCGDPSTETQCNDDRATMPHSLASYIEVLNAAAGSHTIVVDSFDMLMTGGATTLTVRLRPVLDAGATCDPMGVMNRCHAAACPTTGTAVCP